MPHVLSLWGTARNGLGRTDYIDLCGEPEFMQLMTLKYHEAAQAKGVIVMHACAFGEHCTLGSEFDCIVFIVRYSVIG